MLNNLSIILVEPQGDENVGMVARAIKNCGILDLRLINPKPFKTRGGYKWACSANDIIEGAKEYPSLEEAVKDVSFVVGLSRREGKKRPCAVGFSKAFSKVYAQSKKGRTALVFGREDNGLLRNELDLCDMTVTIPTSLECPSLNLSQAVLLSSFEIFRRYYKNNKDCKRESVCVSSTSFAPRENFLPIIGFMDKTLFSLGYDDKDNGKLRRKILKSFSELFGRGGLRHKDIKMFIGLMSRIGERIK